MTTKKHKYSTQSGRSMLEILGVLAIVGILTVAAIAMYSTAMLKNKNTKAMEQIQALLPNIQSLFKDQKDYSALSVKTLYAAKALPESIKPAAGGAKAMHGWGGEIVIGPEQDDPSAFFIEYRNIPETACTKLAFETMGDNLALVTIGGSSYKPPLTDAHIIASCRENVTVRFTYQ